MIDLYQYLILLNINKYKQMFLFIQFTLYNDNIIKIILLK